MTFTSLYAFSVRALLAQGWFEQPCRDDAEACALFDRLCAYEGVQLQRVSNGRIVEVRNSPLQVALDQLAVRTPVAA
jgi:hypothetical protein